MKKLLVLIGAFLMLVCSLASADFKIGVVDADKVVSNSPQLAKAKETMNKNVNAKEKEMADAQKNLKSMIDIYSKNSPTMKEADKKAEQAKIMAQQQKMQDMGTKFQQELEGINKKFNTDINNKLQDSIKKVAEDKKLDLVVTKVAAPYNKKELDITEDVAQQMKK